MAIILHIETSTITCSAALSENEKILIARTCNEGMAHASKLPVFIDEILQFSRQNNIIPDAIAVSAGPGSYTGLRIGVSTAKGLCYGFDAKLLAIDTLQLTAEAARTKIADENALICPMIDARRMEVYTALFDKNRQRIEENSAKIIDNDSFAALLENNTIYFCGNGAEKCKNVITHPNAKFLDEIVPLAENMVALANEKWAKNEFENVAYFEPFYLKEFQATTPKTN